MTGTRELELIAELQNILEATLNDYVQLKEAIEEEKNDIVNNRSLKLDEINDRKEEVTNHLKIMNDARMRITSELAGLLGIAMDGLTISKILSYIPREISQKLTVLRDKLKKMVEEVASAASTTTRLVGSSMKFVQDRLNIVKNVKPVTTYSSRGSIQEFNLKQGNMVSYSA